MTLDDVWKYFLLRSVPTEVLVSRTGDKIDGAAAKLKDMQWDAIYFRDDGYSLAADFYLSPYIVSACTDPVKPWIGKILRGQQKPVAFRA